MWLSPKHPYFKIAKLLGSVCGSKCAFRLRRYCAIYSYMIFCGFCAITVGIFQLADISFGFVCCHNYLLGRENDENKARIEAGIRWKYLTHCRILQPSHNFRHHEFHVHTFSFIRVYVCSPTSIKHMSIKQPLVEIIINGLNGKTFVKYATLARPTRLIWEERYTICDITQQNLLRRTYLLVQ